MSATSYILGIGAALITLFVVIEMLRRRRLRERHAIWWLVAGVLALIVGIFPGMLDWAADLVGVVVPINLVFFISVVILFLVSIQQSSELTKLDDQTRMLAEHTSLLDMRVRELEQQALAHPASEQQ